MNLIVSGITLIGILIFSLYLSKKSSLFPKAHGFFSTKPRLPFLGLMFTMLATQLDGGTFFGAADEAYERGWGVLFYPLGVVIGILILGCGFGARMRSFQLTTVSEIFEKIYKSKGLRQFASLLSMLSFFFILVAQGIAAKKFFVALGFESALFFICFWSMLVLYAVLGGLKSLVKAEFLQSAFILGSFLIIFLCLWHKPLEAMGTSSLFSSQESIPWVGWLLMPLLFMLIEQDVGEGLYATKSRRTLSLAALCAGLILLLATLIPIYLGRLARIYDLQIPEGGSVLLSCATAFFGPTVSSFLMVAILMAILSSSDSLLCSISSNLVNDFPFFQKNETLFGNRLITFFGGIMALVLSFMFDGVVQMLIFSYELTVSIITVPFMMALIRKKGEKGAAITSILCSSIGFFLIRLINLPGQELVPLLLSMIGFWGYLGIKALFNNTFRLGISGS